MPRFIKKKTASKGTMPGSLILIGKQKQEDIRIRVMKYDSNNLIEEECTSLDQAFSYMDSKYLTWINIDGIHDPTIVAEIGKRFNVNMLMLEDFMNTDHRPKFEDNTDLIFIIAKLISLNKEQNIIESDQLSMLIGPSVIITLQEKVGTHFNLVRERIRITKNKRRLIHVDYLAFALLDCLVDNMIEIVGEIGSSIEELDKEVLGPPKKETMSEIYLYRTEMKFLRRTSAPLKEIAMAFLKSESPIVRKQTRDYLKDLHDHVVALNETIDFYQLMVTDQMNIYNASVSNKANEIMKTLTIFAALFIPLTFLAGIYGMNFEVLPELSWPLGYLFFWIVAVLLSIALLFYFKRRKWF